MTYSFPFITCPHFRPRGQLWLSVLLKDTSAGWTLATHKTNLLLNIMEKTLAMAIEAKEELMHYWWRACVLIKSAVDSQLHCGSAGAAWCSSEATGGLDPSRRASSWPWQEPRPSFLSPPHPHLHLSRRMSCPRCYPPPAGTPAETAGIK